MNACMLGEMWLIEMVRFLYAGSGERLQNALTAITLLAILFLVAWLANWVAKKIIVRVVQRVVKKTRVTWDDTLARWKVFHKLSHLAPAFVLYHFSPYALEGYAKWNLVFENTAIIYMVLATLWVLDSALNAFLEIYQSFDVAKDIPIKGFIQVVKLVVYIVGGILILSISVNKSPGLLLSGLGAMTAVLILVFRDPILGFVAGIQLTTNKMVAVGDWIEMPKHGADGSIVEIALTTVKVRNWDKTITTIPTYALISDSFKNWRGMSESGGRRIKRSINLDMSTIRFCTEEMLERYSKITYIAEYIEVKKRELEEFNRSRQVDLAALANGRRMTNIGTFRAYVVSYLKNHPMINQDMTFLVRQLQPTEHGLPLEIYVFCKDKVWASYEAIQADIFDHILAVVPEFDLKLFQAPAGTDFQRWRSALGESPGIAAGSLRSVDG